MFLGLGGVANLVKFYNKKLSHIRGSSGLNCISDPSNGLHFNGSRISLIKVLVPYSCLVNYTHADKGDQMAA